MSPAEQPDRSISDGIEANLRRLLSQKKFDLWFSGLCVVSADEAEVVLSVEDNFQLDWIRANYVHVIETAVAAVLGGSRRIRLVSQQGARRQAPVVAATGPAPAPPPISRPAAPATPEGVSLNPAYSLENFVVGPSNQLASAAARAVADAPAGAYNPLFIHGATGLGKTHLLQGICARAILRRADLKVLYLSSETFINQFIAAIEQGDLDRFRYRYRSVDLLLIDDIHLLANKDRTQEEFFHTFNTLYNERRQIVLSSDCPPAEIPTLRDRLVSRFEWGLVAEIGQPQYETRLAILKRKAKDRGAEVPHDVLAYLAERIDRNIRELEGGITKVLGCAELFGRPIDLDLARQAMQQAGDPGTRPVTHADEILDHVCRHYGVAPGDVRGRRRTQSIVLPRQVLMFLCRQLTNMSFEEIGRHCGGRDHSTALYAVRKVEQRSAQDLGFAHTLSDLAAALQR